MGAAKITRITFVLDLIVFLRSSIFEGKVKLKDNDLSTYSVVSGSVRVLQEYGIAFRCLSDRDKSLTDKEVLKELGVNVHPGEFVGTASIFYYDRNRFGFSGRMSTEPIKAKVKALTFSLLLSGYCNVSIFLTFWLRKNCNKLFKMFKYFPI